MTITAVTFDCADPLTLAAFYAEATGLAVVESSSNDFAGVRGNNGLFIGFQRVEDYRPPSWPGQREPQQAHLDFEVEDLDIVEAVLLRRGARKPAEQPGKDRWRVLTDPAGHPFCLTLRASGYT